MKVTDWTYAQGVYVTNAYRWYREGCVARSGAEGRLTDPAASVVGAPRPAGKGNWQLARLPSPTRGAAHSWWMSARRPMTW